MATKRKYKNNAFEAKLLSIVEKHGGHILACIPFPSHEFQSGFLGARSGKDASRGLPDMRTMWSNRGNSVNHLA